MRAMYRILWICLAAFSSISVAAAEFAGRRVSEVLDELSAQGLVFIYNTTVVPDELRVSKEPRTQSGVALAREILAEHGLALLAAAPNTFAVVKEGKDKATAEAAAATDATLAEVVVFSSRY